MKKCFFTIQECGITNRTGRFIGGSELTPHEFPWMALIMSIGIKPERHQTGTLINDRYIITSATQLFGLVKKLSGYEDQVKC